MSPASETFVIFSPPTSIVPTNLVTDSDKLPEISRQFPTTQSTQFYNSLIINNRGGRQQSWRIKAEEAEPAETAIKSQLQAQEGRPVKSMDLANNRGLNLLLNFLLIVMVLVLVFILVKLM
ncbi:cardiac phospholamban isoform X1 [Alligator mississippiensis]|uniref:Uncharacterized protein n=1 Tax=Alligator mississippiensis TaxID=8496 RepID=A0A151M329_ALLMI|nr:cardiac phospholamban isoform X1 [Alligator mississippiensis]KYO18912.1 hypothetical protein Y1Q_0018890 [Alligator mississippiensis]